ncbi:MAG: indolepyruvate oxidoreductase subunit beta [candidate division Zixibacteria bacterium]|nr:indolepyruvate oxidoreductase subunit beta [candidate division Zixibacteria bacterium]NIR62261.1 indolepyruvate oxidoreductase subunit beta [candidate division Zixibacteria bacterium]NIS14839.1 indolepyruvate oxidoreductase subunit beta [candidate division Zixibacteria bacterium]NIS44497.1 indolepyruvate oxidoreductase subunit beta [candidate division Zixibacteria bacterium]NIU12511.1 indolepyruvate oxidoreductase subunit beta [candidate division Zixibacteria bacterium]
MKEAVNILIVGVGGQGVLLASEVLSETAMKHGLDVKKSEVHGMSQRGGVVTSHVRIAETVYSPLIQEGTADYLIAFEISEGLRALDWLKSGGTVISSMTRMVPPITTIGDYEYPMDPAGKIREIIPDAKILDADKIAADLGNVRLVNTILLGVLSTTLSIPEETWLEVITKRVPKKFIDANLEAFKKGREYNFKPVAVGE